MSTFARRAVVAVIGLWMLGTSIPDFARLVTPSSDVGLSVGFDGVVTAADPGSPAAAAGILPGDRIVPPLPYGLFRQPLPRIAFNLQRGATVRAVVLVPRPYLLSRARRLLVAALYASFFVFLIVGTFLLLMRPSVMTWAFYFFCLGRRYGDLGFYWPGSDAFFWTNVLTFAALGGMSCIFVTIFALRFPSNSLSKFGSIASVLAAILLVPFAAVWPWLLVRFNFQGLPTQSLANMVVRVDSFVYVCAAAIFVATLRRSHGEERHRLAWVLIFPAVLLLRVVAINQGNGLFPYSLPEWFPRAITVLAVGVPLAVAYAVVRQRVFDIRFAISRALVYAAITSLIAGSFFLLDSFMSRQFAQTRFTITAEIILALAIGSWLNMLHRSVDRFVDSTFFRQRHLAEERLAKAAVAILRAESRAVVDRFLVHEPLRALELTSAALFHRDATGSFVRETAVGWDSTETRQFTSDHPLLLHLLAAEGAVRLADVVWPSEASTTHFGDAVLAMPVLLRDELVAIVLYGPHRSGADIDPDEVRALTQLVDRAGAAYDHIEARILRDKVESLLRERDAKQKEIEALKAGMA